MGNTARFFHPGNFTALCRRDWGRFVFVAVGLFPLAGTAFAQAAASSGNSRQAAISREQQGGYDGAESAWRTYLFAHPSSAEAYAHLGMLEAAGSTIPKP